MTSHPIRLVLTDDLRRSRLTAFFRFFLAIPHLVWAALFGLVAFFVVFASWWVTLFSGRTPKGMHDFLAGYVRYVTHVEAYWFLAANPFPGFFMGSGAAPYPVDLEIAPPAEQRRAVTCFRLFLFLPAALIATALTGGGTYLGSYRAGGGVVSVASILIWFAAVFRARAPRGLRDLAVWGIGYSAQVAGYIFLLTDRYPNSDPRRHPSVEAGDSPTPPVEPDDRLRAIEELQQREPGLTLAEAFARVDAPAPEGATATSPEELFAGQPIPTARGVVAGDLRRSRLTVLFRLPLFVPHLVWFLGWTVLAFVAAFVGWFAALALGRMPRPFARFLAAYVRYGVHAFAFLYLVGNPFPGFIGKPGSYPVDVEFDPFGRQRRVTILFRLFLALPAFLVSAGGAGLAEIVGILGWFASLVTGRMPEGLRNGGAWALTYSGQVTAYLLGLSERYPYSSPRAVEWRS